jgi:hypothetical protein
VEAKALASLTLVMDLPEAIRALQARVPESHFVLVDKFLGLRAKEISD